MMELKGIIEAQHGKLYLVPPILRGFTHKLELTLANQRMKKNQTPLWKTNSAH